MMIETKILSFFQNRERPIIWKNAFSLILLHVLFVYSLFYVWSINLFTFIFGFCYGNLASFGVITGAHRLWSHHSYKAKLPLRIFLMICHCVTGMYDTIQFVRDHRLHHKYADTNADPHNIKQGLFYAHMGWLMIKRHPELRSKSETIDYSDALADPVLQFQRRHYPLLVFLFHVLIPSSVTYFICGETLHLTFIALIIRVVITINAIWCINSLAHYHGDKTYNRKIEARQNKFVSSITYGEGNHNYHHTFPWDYRVKNDGFHLHNAFIDCMARIGQAYDLKTASEEMIEKVLEKNSRIKDTSVYQEQDDPYEVKEKFT